MRLPLLTRAHHEDVVARYQDTIDRLEAQVRGHEEARHEREAGDRAITERLLAILDPARGAFPHGHQAVAPLKAVPKPEYAALDPEDDRAVFLQAQRETGSSNVRVVEHRARQIKRFLHERDQQRGAVIPTPAESEPIPAAVQSKIDAAIQNGRASARSA